VLCVGIFGRKNCGKIFGSRGRIARKFTSGSTRPSANFNCKTTSQKVGLIYHTIPDISHINDIYVINYTGKRVIR